MSQPVRLREGSDAELRELMRYAQAHGAPSAASTDALTARVLAQLNAPPSEPTATGFGTAKWLIGAALLLALGGGAYRWLAREHAREQPSAQPVRAPEPRARVVAPIAARDEPATAQPEAARASEVEPRAPRRQPIKPTRASQRTGANEPSAVVNPAEEIALLSRARNALTSDPRAALALASQHLREHPAGVFSEEREAIAIEALWRTGDFELASSRLRAMLLAYPRSSYRERLAGLLARSTPAP